MLSPVSLQPRAKTATEFNPWHWEAKTRVVERKDSPESSVDLHQESRGLLPARCTRLPAMPLDMPQSLCVLDHAGTGREGNSAKTGREWSREGMMDEKKRGMQEGGRVR